MALRGEDGWQASHIQTYGQERWAALYHALQRDLEHACFCNPFLTLEAQGTLEREYSLLPSSMPGAYSFEIPEDPSAQYRVEEHADEGCIFVEPDRIVEVPSQLGGMAPFFFLEGASVIVTLALRVEEEDRVLDMCAAPGGKALVLASSMFSPSFREGERRPRIIGRLVCNEASKEKARKMQRAMMRFLPAFLFEDGGPHTPHVVFTSADPGTSHNSMERQGPYDKILLDAPCTADRQLIRGGSEKLIRWSAATPKVSSERQLKWLSNALWQLKDGGLLLFCSRSLAPEECDGVIERLMLKSKGTFELEALPLEEDLCRMVPSLAAEATDWGTRIMPDRTPYGPIYFSRLRLLKRTHQDVTCIGNTASS